MVPFSVLEEDVACAVTFRASRMRSSNEYDPGTRSLDSKYEPGSIVAPSKAECFTFNIQQALQPWGTDETLSGAGLAVVEEDCEPHFCFPSVSFPGLGDFDPPGDLGSRRMGYPW